MSKKKEQVLDPNVHEELILDIGFYEKMVREYKLKQMGNIKLTEREFIETVNIYIDEMLGNIRATLVENNVNEVGIIKCMSIYENVLYRVRDDKTPPPPPKLVVDNDEKSTWGIGKYVASGVALGGTILGAWLIKKNALDDGVKVMGKYQHLSDDEDEMY